MNSQTPKKITNAIKDFCMEICPDKRPQYITITPTPGSHKQECFSNVDMKISECGGKVQYGWIIWEWENVYIEAEFHAVWVDCNGRYVDVTPQIEREILFLPDNKMKFNGERTDNIRRALRDKSDIIEFLKISEQIFRITEKGKMSIIEYNTYKMLATRHEELKNKLKNMIVGKNELCPCKSGRKYKSCHGKFK